MDGKEVIGWDGMNLVLPFWNFIVGEQTRVNEETLEIPRTQLVNQIITWCIYLFVWNLFM